MLKRVGTFFKPPIFPEDEDKTRKAFYAHVISLAFVGVVLLYELFIRFTRPSQRFDAADLALLGIAITGMVCWWLLRKGKLLLTSILLVVLLWTASNGIAASGYGIRDASFIINSVIMLIAALLLGWQASLMIAVISILAAFGLAYAEASGLIVTTEYLVTYFAWDISVVFVLSALFIGLLINGLENAVKRSRKSLKELESANIELSHAQTDLHARTVELTATNELLQKRSERLRAVAEVARTASSVQNFDRLLPLITSIISHQLGYYHVGIFMVDEQKQYAILRSANTDGGLKMLARGHRLKVGEQGIVGFVTQTGMPRIALDVGQDAVFFNNPDLPMTRSEVALPLVVRNKVLGVLDIQSDIPQAFTMEDIDVLVTLADQVAVAIENSRLLDEAQAALMQLEAVTALRTREAWSQKLQEKERVFTYTPLGLRAEKPSQVNGNASVIPISLRGQKIGSISIARKGDAKWSRLDEDLIAEVATQVGLAVDNIRLLEEATLRARQEQTVGELASRFSQSLDIDTLLQTAARELGQLPDVSEVSVFISQAEKSPQSQPSRSKRSAG